MFGNLYDVGAEYEMNRSRDAERDGDETRADVNEVFTNSVAPQFSRRCFVSSVPAGSNSAWNTVSGSCAGNSTRKTRVCVLPFSPPCANETPRGAAKSAGGSERLRRRFLFRERRDGGGGGGGGGGGSVSTGEGCGVGSGGSARVLGGAARRHASRTQRYAFSR
jgi:hypothetical protein